MARKIVALILLALLTIAASAQDNVCNILIFSQVSGVRANFRYSPESASYIRDDSYFDILRLQFEQTMWGIPIFNVSFPPEPPLVGLITGEAATGYALQVRSLAGVLHYSYALEASSFARYQWLTDKQVAITECFEDGCRATVVDILTGEAQTLELGPYLPEAYLEWRDSYIVSRLSDGAVGLWDFTGQFRPYASGEQVDSRPIISPDGRYVALRLITDDGPRLRILDLIDSKLHRTLILQNEETTTATTATEGDEWAGRFPLLPIFGEWHPTEAKILYADSDVARIYDALGGHEVAVIDQPGTPFWYCPIATNP